jgi:dephospho-CoA kinase
MADVVVAVTGGVASGKSAVTDGFAARGIAIADADVAARRVVEPGEPALAEIVTAFGPGCLGTDGRLDRAAMRARVFADPSARRRLEAILHPRIRQWLLAACREAPGPYVVTAIPLLAEGGGRTAYPWLDRILVVDVAETLQRQRLMRRDGVDAALAERMIAAQAGRLERLALADDIIVNDGPLSALDAAVDRLDARYRALRPA